MMPTSSGAATVRNWLPGEIWAQFVFDEPVWISQYNINSRTGSGGQGPGGWILEYSEDGVSWFLADTVTGEPNWVNDESRTYTLDALRPGPLVIAKPRPERAGEFLQAQGDGTADWAKPLPETVSGDSGKVVAVNATEDGYELVSPLGDPGNTFRHWRIIFTEAGGWSGGAAGELALFKEIGDGSSATVGGYVTAGDETYGAATRMFDGNLATDWATKANGVADGLAWVAYHFPEPVWIKEYALSPRHGGNASQTSEGWNLQYSEDGVTWITVDTRSGETGWVSAETRRYTVSSDQPLPVNVPLPVFGRNDKGKVLQVKQDESGAEWGSLHPTPLYSSGTDRVLTDNDLFGSQLLKCDNAGANTVTVNAGLEAITPLRVVQTGTGQTSFVAGAGVTINSLNGNLALAGQYASALLIPDGYDNYILVGDLV